MNSTELLSCPFCGGSGTYVKHEAGMRGTQGFDRWDAVACRSCGGTVGACDRRFRNKDDAAATWNRRASINSVVCEAGGWIPVTERLPEVRPCGEPGCPWCATSRCCDSVLVIYKPGYIQSGSRFQTCATQYLHKFNSEGAITHWMPLPPPPGSARDSAEADKTKAGGVAQERCERARDGKHEFAYQPALGETICTYCGAGNRKAGA